MLSLMTLPRVLELADPHYPKALRRLPQPPPILHVQGRLELLERPGIAVVGTRCHTTYGRDATVSIVLGLVRAGYVIVSGLARGIDSIAHRTALDVGGDTVGVLGTGLDVPYPPEHEDLAALMAERGCLVTEFPPGTPPLKYHFPQRNRLIAGLARAVLVVEAPEKSGALITAHYALDEGKEIFAVPGPIHNESSRGTHRLIQDGAFLVASAADILDVLGSRAGEPTPLPDAESAASCALGQTGLHPGASELARRVWAALEAGAVDVEDLSGAVGASPGPLATALLELELAGLVQKLPGPRYARAAVVPGS
ncbi:MAG: DNA-processing protein DprA [Gemmatimonadota bacterium]|nr:MAG: DNA-processing protein DprA [Gemmatimonadota bacterium]